VADRGAIDTVVSQVERSLLFILFFSRPPFRTPVAVFVPTRRMQAYKAIGYDDGGIMTRLLSSPKRKESFMTKKEIANQYGIRQPLALEVVQMVFDGIIETLFDEDRIELRNFGVFEVKRRRVRKARNPHTGKSVSVPAKLVVTFKRGMEIGQRVNELEGSHRQK
jgi:nucleoid DNA-binding protein